MIWNIYVGNVKILQYRLTYNKNFYTHSSYTAILVPGKNCVLRYAKLEFRQSIPTVVHTIRELQL